MAVIVALTIAPILLTDHGAKGTVLQLAKPYNVTPQSIPKTIVMVLLLAKPIVGMVARMMVIVAAYTTDWKGGYRAGWTGAGCHLP